MAKQAKKVTFFGFRLDSLREETPEQLRDRRDQRERLRERMAPISGGWALGFLWFAIWLGTEGAPWDDVAGVAGIAAAWALIAFGLTKTGAAKARRLYGAFRSWAGGQ
jgi:hypothetical protein